MSNHPLQHRRSTRSSPPVEVPESAEVRRSRNFDLFDGAEARGAEVLQQVAILLDGGDNVNRRSLSPLEVRMTLMGLSTLNVVCRCLVTATTVIQDVLYEKDSGNCSRLVMTVILFP